MVFKRESVYARLKRLEEVLVTLRAQGLFSPEGFKKDVRLQWVIERGLELAASLVLDIGNHILAGAFQTSVDEYEQILEKLNEKKCSTMTCTESYRAWEVFGTSLSMGI